MKQKIKYLMAASLLCFLGCAIAVSNQNISKKMSSHTAENLLFLQTADKLQLTPKKNHCYKMTLSGIEPTLLYFTDHPVRASGIIKNQDFIKVWRIANVNPNVMISAHEVDNKTSNKFYSVFTFSNPQYDAPKNQMQFDACPINSGKNIEKWHKTYYEITLFYDPLCYFCRP